MAITIVMVDVAAGTVIGDGVTIIGAVMGAEGAEVAEEEDEVVAVVAVVPINE